MTVRYFCITHICVGISFLFVFHVKIITSLVSSGILLQLEEAISFVKDNGLKLLNTENITLYPVSSRSALEAKLMASYDVPTESAYSSLSDLSWGKSSFYQLERFLYSFLDGSTAKGMERVKLKLETPIAIAEQLISSCDALLRRDCERAKEDLNSVLEVVSSIKIYRQQMENESISWRRKVLSLVILEKH